MNLTSDALLSLLDSLQEVVWIRAPAGPYLFINKAVETMYGVPREDLMRDPWAWARHVAPEQREEVLARAAEGHRGPVIVEYELRVPGGDRRWARVHLRPFHEVDGTTHVAGTSEDITSDVLAATWRDRLAHAEAERDGAVDAEERLRAILDRMTDGFFALDPDWRVLYANRRFEELTGVASDGIVGSSLFDAFPEARGSIFQRKYEQALSSGETVEFEAYYEPLSIWFDVHVYPSEDELSIFVQDVTEKRCYQEELRRSEARYRSLTDDVLDSSPIGTAIVDAGGRVVWINRTVERLFGLDREMALGTSYRTLLDEHVRPRVHGSGEAVERLLETPPGAGGEEEMRELRLWDGEERWIAHSASAVDGGLYDGGRIDHFCDVTERRRLEMELVRVTSDERRRIGGELHDSVGQRLTGAGYMLQALEARLERGEALEVADIVPVREILGELTGSIRRLSRGLFPLDLLEKGLAGALRHLAGELEEMFGIRCDVDVPEALGVGSESSLHLFRIAQEFLTNGVKHGEASSASLAVQRSDAVGELTVTHDGSVPPRTGRTGGLGIRLIEYRAHILGASLEITAAAPDGARLVCRFPLEVAS